MRKKIYFAILIILIIAVLIISLGIVNSMVSLKYETGSSKDCISNISGTDLCISIKIMKILNAIALLSLYALLLFKNKILKTSI